MISVIIPAYKNTSDLVRNLLHNLPYLKDCEVIVVNDNPEKSIKKELVELDVKLVENEKNLGFGGAVNAGVEKARGGLILLLNSDVILNDSRFKKAVKKFEDNEVLFAVSFAQKEKDGTVVGKNKILWDAGLLKHSNSEDMESGYTAWAEGGASLVDKKKFLKLGGFDSIYYPFYWEDIDLSYRAWKAGFEILFDPSIRVEHHHESTIGKYFEKKEIKRTSFKNQHAFVIKNITDAALFLSYWLLLVPNFIYYFLKGEPMFTVGFFDALGMIGKIAKSKSKQSKYFIVTDSRIISRFS